MKYVRVIKKASAQRLEDEVNNILIENDKDKLVDIKYSTSYNDSSVIYSVVIIFEKN